MKIRRLLNAVCAIAIFLLAPFQVSASIIDQNQPRVDTAMAGFEQGDLAQSFQQSSDNISGAGIYLSPPATGTQDTVTISLWDALPNSGGNILASGSAIGTAANWVDVFWNLVSVTPDTTLFLVFTSANDILAIAGHEHDPYSRGHVYANPGFEPFPVFDYTFRTYANAVPIPAAVWLFGSGLVGLIGISRRWKVA